MPPPRRQRSYQPCLERLEDRLAPATFNVNSTADVLNPATGTVTLRSAIQAANNTAGDNTINLTVAGTYQITLAPSTTNVVGAAVTATGSGYTSAPAVSFSGGGGTGAAGFASIDPTGIVTSVTITNSGTAYTTAPTITLGAPPAGGSQATATGIVGENDNAAGEFAILSTGGTLTIQNTSGGTAVIDGNQLARVFDINPNDTTPSQTSAVAFAGVTIQNASIQAGSSAAGSGGGIRDTGPISLTLTNVTVTNNQVSGDGGGIAMTNPVNTTWNLTLTGSTLSNNKAGGGGGGIVTQGDNPNFGFAAHNSITLKASTISGNTAAKQGGGVWLASILGTSSHSGVTTTVPFSASLNVTNSTVNGNSAGLDGGGIAGSNLFITNSTVANNSTSGYGGGVASDGGPQVVESIFTGNSAGTDGGGLMTNDGGNIGTSEFRGNTAGVDGGGVFANSFTFNITDSTFVNNTAAAAGGGIEIQTKGTGNTSSTFENVTFTGNRVTSSTGSGGAIDAGASAAVPPGSTGGNTAFTGGLFLWSDTLTGNSATTGGGISWTGASGSYVQVMNTILAQNTATLGPDAANGAGSFTDAHGNLIGVSGAGSGNTGFTDPTTQTGTVAAPLNPMLAALGNNGGPTIGAPGSAMTIETEAVPPGCPAFDKGVEFSSVVNVNAPQHDARLFSRDYIDTTKVPDVGAFEFQDIVLTLAVTPPVAALGPGRKVTFTITVTNTSGNDLPADNSTVTIVLSPGLTATGPLAFTVGTLAAGASATFTVTAVTAAVGAQTVSAALASPDSTPTTVSASTTYTVLTAQEGFVQAVYLNELGRAGAVGELDYWVGKLNGGATQTGVASTILHSPEASDHLVKGWYQTYLGRPAVNGEEQFWVNQMLAGQTEEQVLSGLLGTSEFFNHAAVLNGNGSPQQSFVNALYQLLLNRSPSATDLNYWIGQVQAVGQQAVAFAFLIVPEYRTDTVTGYYNNLLHRSPDANGLAFWVNSGLDLATVRGDIEGTPEFFTNG